MIGAIILIVFEMILCTFMGYLQQPALYILGCLCVILLIFMSFAIFDKELKEKYYKQGQIDALTGKIHYKIEIDSTKNWVEIKK